jgi:L-ascorbate metabolism protein UlaG (beta-lactamase superfamily)
MKITMIGHSTTLVETGGMRILTDPYFGLRGNPAYARLRPPARTREEMKDIDLVLLSHLHWDHTDRGFLRSLSDSVPVLAPHGRTFLARCKGARNVIGLHPGQQREYAVRITAVPALHIASTIGFVIEAEDGVIYFAGDTYLGKFMKKIGADFRLDAALMPVTTYRLPMTMGEKDAVRAVSVLKPRVVIPIHLGIAPRSTLLRTSETAEHFRTRVQQAELPAEVVILREGEVWEYNAGSENAATSQTRATLPFA